MRRSQRLSGHQPSQSTVNTGSRRTGVQVPAGMANFGGQPAGAGQAQPVQAPPVPVFGLTPALASRGVIDYQSRSGERLYASATKQLEDEKYDGEATGLHQFLESLEKRASNFGWDTGIMMIPNANGPPSSLLRDYGTIEIQNIRQHEISYITSPTREAQDTNLLHECIMNSISREGRAKITIWKNDYMVNGYPSGNLLLKVLMRECHLDTNATSGGIGEKLSSLDEYLPKVGYDVLKFNMYVKNLVIQLKARGESSNDLLTNLFKGYLAATDKSFVAYIDKKLELYEEGSDISPDQLMLWARQKYDLLREKGTWNAPTEEEEKIIALEAQVKKMEKQIKEKSKEKSQSSNRRGSNDRRATSSQARKEKPEWFTKEPEDPTKKVMWNNKEWNWCGKATGGKCESFVRHPPKQCKGIKKRKTENKDAAKATKIKVETAEVDEISANMSQQVDTDDDGYLS